MKKPLLYISFFVFALGCSSGDEEQVDTRTVFKEEGFEEPEEDYDDTNVSLAAMEEKLMPIVTETLDKASSIAKQLLKLQEKKLDDLRDLNTSVHSFPNNVIAGAFGFKEREFFELGEGEAAARQPVAVKF